MALLATLTEVELTLDHPSLQVATYLLNPEGCAQQLRAHLEPVLLRKGKERLAAADHLGALQLFNRLLALDENNPEVLSLIQGLHQPTAPDQAPRRWVALLACTLVLVGALGVWWLRASAAPAGEPPAPALTAAVDLPVAPPPPVSPGPELPAAAPVPESAASPATARLPRGVILPLAPRRVQEPAPPSTGDAPVAVVAPATASLVVVSLTSAEVWLDNGLVGTTRTGPSTDWVASRKAPLSVAPGHHVLTLKYRNAEDWVQPFDATAGQQLEFMASPTRLPVNVVINRDVPKECSYTVDGMKYGQVANVNKFDLHDPDPGTQVVFTCPDRTFTVSPCRNGQCNGGNTVIVPEAVPQ